VNGGGTRDKVCPAGVVTGANNADEDRGRMDDENYLWTYPASPRALRLCTTRSDARRAHVARRLRYDRSRTTIMLDEKSRASFFLTKKRASWGSIVDTLHATDHNGHHTFFFFWEKLTVIRLDQLFFI